MNKMILLLCLSIISSASAQSFFNAQEAPSKQGAFFADADAPAEGADETLMTFEAGEKKYERRDGHWGLNLNVTGAQFRPNYKYTSSTKYGKSIDNDPVLMFGPTIEFGYDYHISPRIVGATKIQTFYYQGSNNDSLVTNNETLDVSIYTLNVDAQSMGVGFSQMLGHDFKYSTYILRPYFNYAVGMGKSDTKMTYNYSLSDAQTEGYNIDISDSFIYNSLSLGFEVISKSGISFNIAGTRSGLISGDTTRTGKRVFYNGSLNNETVDEKVDSATGEAFYSLSLGMGYYF